MGSAIPDAISGLLTALRASTALQGVTIYDGPPVSASGRKDYICVAHNADTDTFEFDREWAGIGALRQEEAFSIACSARVWSGSTSMTERRARAFDLLDAVEAALATNRTLDGAVRVAAVLGRGSLKQSQIKSGAVVDLAFSVGCEARISTT